VWLEVWHSNLAHLRKVIMGGRFEKAQPLRDENKLAY